MIKATNLSKTYGPHKVLNLDLLEIPKGESLTGRKQWRRKDHLF